MSWISEFQLGSGGFPSYFSRGEFKRETSPDMTAQVLRFWLILDEFERPKIDFLALHNQFYPCNVVIIKSKCMVG